jgi:arsenate reductase (thioredoxin)
VTRKYKVLFLCRGNSACSIVAEALLRELAGHRFEAFSAGPDPAARLHPLTVAQLRSGFSKRDALGPKSWLEFTGEWAPRMDLVIALDEAVGSHHAPVFPGAPAVLAWNVADPFASDIAEEERERLFDKMFWQLVRQVSALIEFPQFEARPGRGSAVRNRISAATNTSDAHRADDELADGASAAPNVLASDAPGNATARAPIGSADRATICDA